MSDNALGNTVKNLSLKFYNIITSIKVVLLHENPLVCFFADCIFGKNKFQKFLI